MIFGPESSYRPACVSVRPHHNLTIGFDSARSVRLVSYLFQTLSHVQEKFNVTLVRLFYRSAFDIDILYLSIFFLSFVCSLFVRSFIQRFLGSY